MVDRGQSSRQPDAQQPREHSFSRREGLLAVAGAVGLILGGGAVFLGRHRSTETHRNKEILGGEWVLPSPGNHANVGSEFTLAAWADPVHSNDPRVAYVQFTIYRDGAHLPGSKNPDAWPIIATVNTPVRKDQQGRDIYEARVNLGNIPGFPKPAPGDSFKVSFDVYNEVYAKANINGTLDNLPDGNPTKEANRKRAPNGVHTLIYNPT